MENKIKMLHEEERSLYEGKIVLPNKITAQVRNFDYLGCNELYTVRRWHCC